MHSGAAPENSGTLVPLCERFPVLALEMGPASNLEDPAPFYTIFPQRNIPARTHLKLRADGTA
jgi:hypothetical protein